MGYIYYFSFCINSSFNDAVDIYVEFNWEK